MRGPIFAVTSVGTRDALIHETILTPVNFAESKAISDSYKRAISIGLTPTQG
jgi:hypothetical protein